jgi:AcrR family transcriptional regulator
VLTYFAMARMSAEERKDAIIDVAIDEFGAGGLAGTNVEAIARRVRVTQPYVFRLFGTKKALFLACVEVCFTETQDAFESAAAGLSGEHALQAMGQAYGELIQDRSRLRMQLQAYSACDDVDVRRLVRRRYGELVEFVEGVSGVDKSRISAFFATGMMLNVLAATDQLSAKEGWAARLLEGCGVMASA